MRINLPGLVGVINYSGNNIDNEKLLEKMSTTVKHEDWYTLEKHVDHPVYMARIKMGLLNPQPQPIFNEDKTLCILMDGEIYGYEAQKESISRKHKFSVGNDADFILHMYEQEGEKCLRALNGSFNAK